MRYSKEDIERANARDIVQVAEELGMTLKRQGATLMALCPCHEDTHPSMQIGGRRNIAHCYVCGKTLNPISLTMAVRDCSFPDAMASLVNQWGQTPLIHSKPNRKSTGYMNQWGLTPLIHSPEVSYFNMDYVKSHVSIDNALSKCLLQRFPREVVERVTEMYCLGHDENLLHYEHTWFPSIDQYGRCHNIKVQGYCTNPDVPQFAHSVKGQTMWLAAYLQKRGLLDKKAQYETGGLFGAWPPSRPPQRGEAHLRTGGSEMYNEKMSSFILVESPKNAVVGACWTMTYRPELDVTWVAVGNKGMLKRSVLEPLRGKKVIVMPDRDAIDEWKKKIWEMRDLATFVFSSFCDSDVEAENKKLDIADLMLSDRGGENEFNE